jgi:hypothetical protein
MAATRFVARRITLGWQVWVIVAVVFALLVLAGLFVVGPALS